LSILLFLILLIEFVCLVIYAAAEKPLGFFGKERLFVRNEQDNRNVAGGAGHLAGPGIIRFLSLV
jgi:hypothetical protein